MWYIETLKYYSALNKNEMVNFAGKWMRLEKKIHIEWGNTDPERQTWNVLPHLILLASNFQMWLDVF